MTPSDKQREDRLRRLADGQDYKLVKSRRRDPNALDYGTYMIVDKATNFVVRGATSWPYDMTLDDVEDFLSNPAAEPTVHEVNVRVRRQFDDWRIGTVPFSKLKAFKWDWISGGVKAPSPQPFVSAVVTCTDIEGEIGHSGAHGPCPHVIKVAINKTDQDPAVWAKILGLVGPRPRRKK